ncbi:MAG: hypothetical protein HQL32_06195 [Planctomycetes bacterium]|nr:hypothetical protein [Planctomycetota bacterium]
MFKAKYGFMLLPLLCGERVYDAYAEPWWQESNLHHWWNVYENKEKTEDIPQSHKDRKEKILYFHETEKSSEVSDKKPKRRTDNKKTEGIINDSLALLNKPSKIQKKSSDSKRRTAEPQVFKSDDSHIIEEYITTKEAFKTWLHRTFHLEETSKEDNTLSSNPIVHLKLKDDSEEIVYSKTPTVNLNNRIKALSSVEKGEHSISPRRQELPSPLFIIKTSEDQPEWEVNDEDLEHMLVKAPLFNEGELKKALSATSDDKKVIPAKSVEQTAEVPPTVKEVKPKDVVDPLKSYIEGVVPLGSEEERSRRERKEEMKSIPSGKNILHIKEKIIEVKKRRD